MASKAWKCRRTSSEQASPRAAARKSRNDFFGPASPTSSSSPDPSPPRRRDSLRNIVIKVVRPRSILVANEYNMQTPRTKSYRGVRYREELNKYVTEIRPTKCSKKIWLGTYDTAEEAARAFDIGNLCCKKNLPLNFPDSPRMLKRISSQLSPDEARSAIAKLAKEVARVVMNSTSDGETVKRDRAAAKMVHELVQWEAEELRTQHLEAAAIASSVTYTEQLVENVVAMEEEVATPMPLVAAGEGGSGGHGYSFDLSQVFLPDDLQGIPDLIGSPCNFDNHGDVFFYTN